MLVGQRLSGSRRNSTLQNIYVETALLNPTCERWNLFRKANLRYHCGELDRYIYREYSEHAFVGHINMPHSR
ncbi:hypothetical protein Agabi119p4_9947 [Agaricus bisporus var. burnettii]|uniref:Uncharacterized protein n=1 Tax=Agaricus bisporus var. burnettii TaxID=192524 RepID=A0A8H7C4Q6_AGABI|nr:hypothetical protein Agabi119p4_9947 [Agaricus bisporus var. burnettii]